MWEQTERESYMLKKRSATDQLGEEKTVIFMIVCDLWKRQMVKSRTLNNIIIPGEVEVRLDRQVLDICFGWFMLRAFHFDAQVFDCFNELYCFTVKTRQCKLKHWVISNVTWAVVVDHGVTFAKEVACTGKWQPVMSDVRRWKHVCLSSASLPFLISELSVYCVKAICVTSTVSAIKVVQGSKSLSWDLYISYRFSVQYVVI